jgi:hypothetical protein
MNYISTGQGARTHFYRPPRTRSFDKDARPVTSLSLHVGGSGRFYCRRFKDSTGFEDCQRSVLKRVGGRRRCVPTGFSLTYHVVFRATVYIRDSWLFILFASVALKSIIYKILTEAW